MVEHIVQAKPVPCVVRQEWVYLDSLISPRAQARKAGDYQIAVARMVVVLAPLFAAFALVPRAVLPAFQSRPRNPVAGKGVEMLVDPRNDAAVGAFGSMSPAINLQRLEVIGL